MGRDNFEGEGGLCKVSGHRAELCNNSSAVAGMDDRMASGQHIPGPKSGGCCAPFRGVADTMSPGPRPSSVPSGILICPTIWLQQAWAENWGLCPLFEGGGAGSQSNTMGPGPSHTSVLSGILYIQPFGHNTQRYSQTEQDRRQTDNGPIAQGEPFYKRSPQNG